MPGILPAHGHHRPREKAGRLAAPRLSLGAILAIHQIISASVPEIDGRYARRSSAFLCLRLLATAVRNRTHSIPRIRGFRMDLDVAMHQISTIVDVGKSNTGDIKVCIKGVGTARNIG